ncbi:MAG: type 4a pilus biogenesis protein PilO [Candidatus Omnitrophota bacterium]|nr:type 4a pilus biogenesis protein PilO [Candidatus Omnitrophota bacterium]
MDKNRFIKFIALGAVIVLFLQFIYAPKFMEVKKLRNQHRDIKAGIAGLYNFIGGEENLKDNLIKMREYVAGLEKTFPPEKEASNIIKQLNAEARDLRINVVSVRPQDMVIYTDARGSQLLVLGRVCKSMPMGLSVEARYQALGDFLKRIETSGDPLVSVRKIEMRKDVNILPKIKAEIELSACVLGD